MITIFSRNSFSNEKKVTKPYICENSLEANKSPVALEGRKFLMVRSSQTETELKFFADENWCVDSEIIFLSVKCTILCS